jgi:hypothetical protein
MSVPNDPANNPQPDVDVTAGRTPLVGDAPPSDGTDVSVSVAPTTALMRAAKAMRHRLGLEGSEVEPTRAQRLHRVVAAPENGPAASFHTASARAAAFPGLQPEIESSTTSTGWHAGSASSSDLPAD